MNDSTKLNKTLQEIEGQDWGEPIYDTSLVINCHRLRRVPLKDFTVEDLRLMIGQQIGLPHLVPLALSVLHNNPLAEGNMYPGDLLSNVFRVPNEFWNQYPELKNRRDEIAEIAVTEIENHGEDADIVLKELKQILKQQ